MGYKMKPKSPLTKKLVSGGKKVAGESTGPVNTDKKGEKYAIFGAGDPDFDSYAGNVGVNPGDTIFTSKKHIVDDSGDKKIMGGDYNVKETKSSKKRKTGPKSFKIKD